MLYRSTPKYRLGYWKAFSVGLNENWLWKPLWKAYDKAKLLTPRMTVMPFSIFWMVDGEKMFLKSGNIFASQLNVFWDYVIKSSEGVWVKPVIKSFKNVVFQIQYFSKKTVCWGKKRKEVVGNEDSEEKVRTSCDFNPCADFFTSDDEQNLKKYFQGF